MPAHITFASPPASRRWPFVALAVASALGALFCVAGYAMAGSFTVSNPEALVAWRRVATFYLVGTVAFFAIFVGSCYVLWRDRRVAGTGLHERGT